MPRTTRGGSKRAARRRQPVKVQTAKESATVVVPEKQGKSSKEASLNVKEQNIVVVKDAKKEEVTVSNEVREEVEELIKKLIDEPTQETTQKFKQLLDAVKTTGRARLDDASLEEALRVAEELRRIDFSNINFIVNPSRSIVTLGMGVSVPPFSIIYLPRVLPDKDALNRLRRSVGFVNAVKSRVLYAFTDLTPEEFEKVYKALQIKAVEESGNILEVAKRKGITSATDFEALRTRDPEVKKWFEERWKEIRRQSGVDELEHIWRSRGGGGQRRIL